MPLWGWIMLATGLVCAYVLINRASGPKRRCPWISEFGRYCLRPAEHDGKCKIRDQFGTVSYWYGINYRKNGDL